MARINIEEKWWNDPRRERLTEFLGDPSRTEGVAVKFWRLSQTHWTKGELIPGHIFIHLFGAKAILDAGLARIYETPRIWLYPERGEECPNGPERPTNDLERELNECRTRIGSVRELWELERYWIYANGSRQLHFWLVKGLLQRIEAGKRSAQARKIKLGTAQPLKSLSNEPERKAIPFDSIPRTTPNDPRTSSNDAEPSSSSSSSNSTSIFKKKKNNNAGFRKAYPVEFESVWLAYDRKGEKKKAFQVFERLHMTEQELSDLPVAIRNYLEAHPDRQYRKDLERFLESDWREHLKPHVAMNRAHPRTQENLNVFNRYIAKIESGEIGGNDESTF